MAEKYFPILSTIHILHFPFLIFHLPRFGAFSHFLFSICHFASCFPFRVSCIRFLICVSRCVFHVPRFLRALPPGQSCLSAFIQQPHLFMQVACLEATWLLSKSVSLTATYIGSVTGLWRKMWSSLTRLDVTRQQ